MTPPRLGRESVARAVKRGLRLADDLHRRGVAVADQVQRLEEIGRQGRLGSQCVRARLATAVSRRLLVRRRLALRNPLLDFDAILFVKSAPGAVPAHVGSVLWLVVAAGRRRVRAGRLQDTPCRGCAA